MGGIRVYLCDDVAALRLKPDVLVLDLSLPELDGLEVLEELARVSPGTRVVVFSGYPEEQLGAAALARGARRYVEKGADIDEVARAVRAVAAEAA